MTGEYTFKMQRSVEKFTWTPLTNLISYQLVPQVGTYADVANEYTPPISEGGLMQSVHGVELVKVVLNFFTLEN